MNPAETVPFLNIEWFFRLFYGLFSILYLIGVGVMAFIASMFDGRPGVGFGSAGGEIARILGDFWNGLTIFSTILSLILAIIVVYSWIRLTQVDKRRKERLKQGLVVPGAATILPENVRWEHVKTLMASANENDWRQAIIEADIILEEMLTIQGYHGEGVGEKLKQVEPADMYSLNDAWSAHKVRNAIAHAGSGYTLTERDARVAIAQFENVFREHNLI
jgi:hypothetical protein